MSNNNVLEVFKKIGRFFRRVFSGAEGRGLTEALVAEVIRQYVPQADILFQTNSEKREWVVAQLMARGIPESIARLALEVAIQSIKDGIEAAAEEAGQ